MTGTNLQNSNLPTDPKTGLILPLTRYLGSQDLSKHRAMVAVELEVMAKKLDRFGWDRDRGSMTHDRMVTDWMDALQDFPLNEVKAACAAWVLKAGLAAKEGKPSPMPNEGNIRAEIQRRRAADWNARKPQFQPDEPAPTPISKDAAKEAMELAGFTPKRLAALRKAPMASTYAEAEELAELPKRGHWSERAHPESSAMNALRKARDENPMIQASRASQAKRAAE